MATLRLGQFTFLRLEERLGHRVDHFLQLPLLLSVHDCGIKHKAFDAGKLTFNRRHEIDTSAYLVINMCHPHLSYLNGKGCINLTLAHFLRMEVRERSWLI